MGSRFVANAVIESPWRHTGLLKYFADDWQIAPIYQMQTGLPYSATVSGSAPSPTAAGGINGSGGTARLDIGRNTFTFPNTWIADLRISKQFAATERIRTELSADFFNIANKQNVTAVTGIGGANGTFYSISGTNLVFNGFGVPTNSNSNFVYSPRQIQFGVRVKF